MKTTRLFLPLLAILAGVSVFLACNKYKDKPYVDPGLPTDQMVTASVQGRVLDQNGVPVQGAVVTSDTAGTTTDVNGAFSFNKIAMSSRFGFVKVTKTGYFTGSRSIITSTGGSNYVTITLIPRTSKGTFPAVSGGTVVVQTGDTVVFDPATIVTASTNAAYTGTVHVYAAYLDPTSTTLSQNMPGDLRGIGSDGKETGLQTFGMMVVEMEGDAGEKLQIAGGKQASLSMTIPDTLRKTAQASIPLWYFNDTTGRWMQQGSAVRAGNSYVGKVGHFTWWNCDTPIPLVSFKAHLTDMQGNPLSYTYVSITETGGGMQFSGFTDSLGFVQGLIIKGTVVQFQVYNPCYTVVFGENVGPALTDQDLGTLKVDMGTATLTLTGTVVDCSNNPVANGYVNAYIDGVNTRAMVTNGAFSLKMLRCSKSPVQAQITAADLGTQQIGSSTTVTVSTGTQDLGQLSACGVSFDQFFNIQVNGTSYSWTNPPDNFYYSGNSSGFSGENASSGGAGSFYMDTGSPFIGPGTISMANFVMITSGNHIYGAETGTANILQVNVTSFGPVTTGYVIGTLSGNVYDSTGHQSYPISGNIKFLRTQ